MRPPDPPPFHKPHSVEQVSNKIFGLLVGLGVGLRHNYLLQVRGRKTGRLRSTPVDLLEFRGGLFLVAGRGRTQWVRNAEAAGEVVLKKGPRRRRFRVRSVSDEKKPEILKAYVECFRLTAQRYFPIAAGAAPQAFAGVSSDYPVFELIPME